MQEDIYILVVDDNKENLKVISGYLREKGYKLALAFDGKNALKILDDNKIDLILLDVMMPEMDGYEVCEKIKQNVATTDIPIIFITAKTDTDDVVKVFQTGGADYLTKPFKKEELYTRVATHVKLKLINDTLKKYQHNQTGESLLKTIDIIDKITRQYK